MFVNCKRLKWTRYLSRSVSTQGNGLMGWNELENSRISSLHEWCEATCRECNQLYENIIKRSNRETTGIHLVEDLDRISQLACRVADTSIAIAHLHEQEEWRQAGRQTHLKMSSFFGKLNSCSHLSPILSNLVEELKPMQVPEHLRLVSLLSNEMEPQKDKTKYLKFQNKICTLEQEFLHGITHVASPSLATCHLTGEDAQQLIDQFSTTQLHQLGIKSESSFKSYLGFDGEKSLGIPVTNPSTIDYLLQTVPSESIRKQLFIASHRATHSNTKCLEQLLQVRNEQALFMQSSSYSEWQLERGHTTNTKDQVMSFLLDLEHRLRPRVQYERETMEHVSKEDVSAWQIPYAQSQAARKLGGSIPSLRATLSAYFPLDQCLKGLCYIIKQLFQCDLIEIGVHPSEEWVRATCSRTRLRKFTLQCSQTKQLYGIIYFDLFQRSSKHGAVANYILENGTAFTPTKLIISCGFPSPLNDIVLLPHEHVISLFHEMGHALHALLSQTQFQHTSGTRGPLDYVELPSQLLEFFALDYRVVSTFAQHYRTGQTLSRDLFETYLTTKQCFFGWKTQSQVVYALFDQLVHGPKLTRSPTEVYHSLQSAVLEMKPTEATSPPSKFHHLASGYGAQYYSYLYCSVMAAHVWKQFFESNPLCPEAGHRFRAIVLHHGNAKDPKRIVQELFNGQQPSIQAFLESHLLKGQSSTLS